MKDDAIILIGTFAFTVVGLIILWAIACVIETRQLVGKIAKKLGIEEEK